MEEVQIKNDVLCHLPKAKRYYAPWLGDTDAVLVRDGENGNQAEYRPPFRIVSGSADSDPIGFLSDRNIKTSRTA